LGEFLSLLCPQTLGDPAPGVPLFKEHGPSCYDTESDSSDDEDSNTDEDSTTGHRGFGDPKNLLDFSRLAGGHEKECMKALGFDFVAKDTHNVCMCGCGGKAMEIGKDKHFLTSKGNLMKAAVLHLSGSKTESYRKLWGARGKVVEKAKSLVEDTALEKPLDALCNAICARQKEILSWREAKMKELPTPPRESIKQTKQQMQPDVLMRLVRKDQKDRMASNRNTVNEGRRKELNCDDEPHAKMIDALLAAYDTIDRHYSDRIWAAKFETMHI